MKFLVILAVVAFVAARPDEKTKSDVYSRYDNFDISPILQNRRSLTGYAECWEGTGKCTPEASDFKKVIPDAMKSNCADCSENQKVQVASVMKAMMDQIPEHWTKLNNHYNPKGEYTDSLKQFVDKYAKKD